MKTNAKLLTEKVRDIAVVKAEDREFWQKIPKEAEITTAERYREKWSDEEVRLVVNAKPSLDSYEALGGRLGRSAGAIRRKRSIMIDLLLDQYEARERAKKGKRDKHFHDYAHVDRILRELRWYKKPVTERWDLAKHLKQPTNSWRGDGTQSVLSRRRREGEKVKQLARLLAEMDATD